MAWEQHGHTLTAALEERAREISGDVDVILGIHLDTPNTSVPRPYQRVPFTEPAPPLPRQEQFAAAEPMRPHVAPLGLTAKLFRSQREKHAAAVRAADAEYERKMVRWSAARDAVAERNAQAKTAYGVALEAWQRRKSEHEAGEDAREAAHASRITTDLDYMELILEQALEDLEWPRETVVTLDFADGGRSVWLDADLPEIVDFPSRTATLSSKGRRLLIKNKTERALREEYARHVHGIGLRIAGVTFWTLPAAAKVILSGYSQRLSKATGRTEDEYLYSVIFDREGFQRTDFTKLGVVDPVEAFTRFPLRRTMTSTGIFKSIRPFSDGDV